MYKLTEKALTLDKIFVHHQLSGDYLLEGYATIDEAREDHADGGTHPCSGPDGFTIQEYGIFDCLDAAEQDFGWPVSLGLVEEDEESD
jgi:hypothetical protein